MTRRLVFGVDRVPVGASAEHVCPECDCECDVAARQIDELATWLSDTMRRVAERPIDRARLMAALREWDDQHTEASAEAIAQAYDRSLYDHRSTCVCGHRYADHATGGTACLGASLDEDQVTGKGSCLCRQWSPARPRVRR